jgi:serine/threonine protein kinase
MLTDFGIAKVLETEEATLTGTGLGVGTPEYMAPEQWQGKTSEATDQYALGVVFYELITGRKPYSADTPAAIILMQATEPLAPPSGLVQGIPENVEKVLYKSLARNPEDRYESIGTLAEILRKLLANTEAEEQGSSRHATQPFQSIPSGNVESTSEGITYDILESTSVEEIPKPLTSNKNEKKGGYSWMGWAFFVSILLILITLVFDFRSISINRSTGDERESISLVTETEEPTVTPTKTATIMPTANPTEEYWNLSVLFDEIYQSGHNHKWTENDKWTLDQQKDLWSRIDEKVLNEVEKIVTDMNTNYRDDFSEAYIGYKPQEVIGNEGLEITLGMVLWGFGSIDDNGHLVGRTGESWDLIYQFPSIEDFKNQILITYDYDIAEAFPYESSDAVDVLEVVKSNFIAFWLTQ